MIQVIREIVVAEESRGTFELAFGPGGAWGRVFAQCPGFRGATLLRDTADASRYLVFELWDSLDLRSRALADRDEEHSQLAASFADWTESESEVGVFTIRTESMVRPVGKKRPSGARRI